MKIDRRTELLWAVKRALDEAGSHAPSISLSSLESATGATAEEIREVLEVLERSAAGAAGDGPGESAGAFRPESRKAIERLLGRSTGAGDGSRSSGAAAEGSQPHVIRAAKHRPWFSAVKDPPKLAPVIHTEPSRDVEVLGEKITKDELRLMLKRMLP